MGFQKGNTFGRLTKGKKISKDMIEKRKQTILKKYGKFPAWSLGRKLSEETKEKIRKANLGKKKSEAQILNQSKRYSGSGNPFYGKKHTEESKRKISLNNASRRPEVKKLIREARAGQVTPMQDSSIEVKLQNFLKDLNIEYYPHQFIREIEHKYNCDIFIPSLNLIIEADGDYWHNYPFGNDIDHIRTKEMIDVGFNVLRLWERDINLMDINTFKEKLEEYG